MTRTSWKKIELEVIFHGIKIKGPCLEGFFSIFSKGCVGLQRYLIQKLLLIFSSQANYDPDELEKNRIGGHFPWDKN